MSRETDTELDDVRPAPRIIGRYVLHDEIAAGGMATVHVGRLVAPVGFSRTVAIKCLHPQFAKDPEFVSMFLDEARLAARIRHPNVVATLDVVALRGELFLVMEYVQGDALSRLIRRTRDAATPIPIAVVGAILSGVLQGLHAAHEAKSERGEPLELVHRDVSPQNVLVGVDGVARVLDFGVAKAVGRLQTTRDGQVKGKTAYMSPEQLKGHAVDRRTDVYAASVVLWESLTQQRLFRGDAPAEIMNAILEKKIDPPSRFRPDVPPSIDAIVLRGLARDPAARFPNALEMSVALEGAVVAATTRQVGEWVRTIAGDSLQERAERLHAIERETVSPPSAVTRHDDGREGAHEEPTIAARPPSKVEPEGTATGSVAMATPASLSAARGRRRNVLAVSVGVGVVLIAAAVWIFSGNRDRENDSTKGETGMGSGVSASASTSTLPSSAPTSTSTSTSTSASATTSVSTWPATKVKPKTPPPKAKTKNCNPPYTIDPDGVHIPKPECE